MTAATPSTNKPTTRKGTRPRTLRLIRWDASARSGVLRIAQGKEVFAYALREIEPGYAERAFQFDRLDAEGGKLVVGEVYHVAVEREGHSCDCRGFVAHGVCKHSAAALKLLEIGSV